jgi:hypothetical protein
MRNHLLSGGLGLILAAACGAPIATSNTSSSSSCVGASNPHRAYVIVEHSSGATMQNCVGFSADFIDGQTLMDRSGIQYQANTISSGRVVCQVDFEPKNFSQCFPANHPYWALASSQAAGGPARLAASATSSFTTTRHSDGTT